MEALEAAERFEVVLVREGDETPVHAGTLQECEDWLALNGDAWDDGHFEIRPMTPSPTV